MLPKIPVWAKQKGTGLPWWCDGKESTCQGRRYRRCRFDPWVRKIPWRRKWQLAPVFLPEKNPMDREAWWATVCEVARSRTRLSDRAQKGIEHGMYILIDTFKNLLWVVLAFPCPSRFIPCLFQIILGDKPKHSTLPQSLPPAFPPSRLGHHTKCSAGLPVLFSNLPPSILHMMVYMCQCCFLNTFPAVPTGLFSTKFISTISLDSTYMH